MQPLKAASYECSRQMQPLNDSLWREHHTKDADNIGCSNEGCGLRKVASCYRSSLKDIWRMMPTKDASYECSLQMQPSLEMFFSPKLHWHSCCNSAIAIPLPQSAQVTGSAAPPCDHIWYCTVPTDTHREKKFNYKNNSCCKSRMMLITKSHFI